MSENTNAERALKLMSEVPLIDGHNDLPIQLREQLANQIYDLDKYNFRAEQPIQPDALKPALETDLLKLHRGKVGGQFWSVFVECKPEDPNRNEDHGAVRDTLEQIDVIKRLIDEHDELEYCTTPDAVIKAFKAGKIASMIGAEGLHQVGSSLANIRMLFELGVRYITVTHNESNVFACCATAVSRGGVDSGLSPVGEVAVREMNRLGMLVDLSHVSTRTMEDALRVSRAPVVFSHSNARALCEHGRNVPDHVLDAVRANGGIVMVNFVRQFLCSARGPESVDADTVVDHIFYIAGRIGWDHVGIGSDFDGCYGDLPEGMKDASCYPHLIEAVLARGATDEQVRKLLGENILRVWREVIGVSDEIKGSGEKPMEDVAPGRNLDKGY